MLFNRDTCAPTEIFHINKAHDFSGFASPTFEFFPARPGGVRNGNGSLSTVFIALDPVLRDAGDGVVTPFGCFILEDAGMLCTDPATFEESDPGFRFLTLVIGITCFAAAAWTFVATL
jgi:hypothetical protein